jgi:hypothetical protein
LKKGEKMRKISFATALAAMFAVLFSAMAVRAQQKSDTHEEFPEWWRSVEPSVRLVYLNQVAKDLLLELQNEKEFFDTTAGKYPFKGVGISLVFAEKTGGTDENWTYGVRIAGVWLGSPAEKLLEPGDWILSVDGKPVCGEFSFIKFANKDSNEEANKNADLAPCLSNTRKVLEEAAGEEIAVEVERSGAAKKFLLGRALVGQVTKDFMNKNESAWEAIWTASAKETADLIAELKTAGEDEAKIDACHQKLQAIIERSSGPANAIWEFLNGQQKLMPEK